MKKQRKLILTLGIILLLILSSCNMPTLNESTEAEQINAQAQSSNLLDNNEPEEIVLPTGPFVEVSELTGEVTLRQSEADQFEAAQDGDKVYLEGQVQTGPDGRARLDFSDGTLVRLGPDSLFTLKDVQADSQDNLLKQVFMQFGQLWIVLNGGELYVDTPSGVASVRGSYLMVETDPDTGNMYATCLEGDCTLELDGEVYEFSNGQTAWITGGTPPEGGQMSQEEVQAWLDNNPEAELVLDQVPGSFGDFVWEDLNGNGLQDEDEPGLEGVEVSLYTTDDTLVDTVVSDANGAYQFENVYMGDYYLKFSLANTLFSIQNAGADDTLDSDVNDDGATEAFTLAPGEHNPDVDAGLVYPGQAAVCPLTGLPTDGELLDLRPIFISISHFPAQATRPSTGINSAPVVFETLIDEGMTRLQALFYCGYPEKLPENDGGNASGSFDISGVRSGRVFYAELAELFGAGLIFGGADPTVYQEISAYQCSLVNNNTPNDIGGAGVDIDRLKEIAENCQHRLGNTDLGVWHFGPAPEGGMAVENFLMYYNYLNQTRWIYDADAGGYVRYQNDPANPEEFSLSTDRLTGEAVVRQNIILLQTPHNVLNRAGTIIDFDLTNEGGYAWLLRDGAIHKVCWSAIFKDYETESNRYRPFLLLDCDTKEPINFAYGSTWVNVVSPAFWFDTQGDFYVAKQPLVSYGD